MSNSDTPFRARFEQALDELIADAARWGESGPTRDSRRALMEMVEKEMGKDAARWRYFLRHAFLTVNEDGMLCLGMAPFGEQDDYRAEWPALMHEIDMAGVVEREAEIVAFVDAVMTRSSASLGEVQHGGQ